MSRTHELIDVPNSANGCKPVAAPEDPVRASATMNEGTASPELIIPPPLRETVDRITVEMTARWRRGDRPEAAEYLALHPEIAGCGPAALAIVVAEVRLRQAHLVDPALETVLARYPAWRAELAHLLPCDVSPAEPRHAWVTTPPPQTSGQLPCVGESFAEFHLVGELGRGVQGAVFLARQPCLSDRLLALKVAARGGTEPLVQARLQHTHIAPLYAAGVDDERGLHWLAMPYLGGTTLAHVIDHARACRPRRDGAVLTEAIDRGVGPPPDGSERGPWKALYRSSTYAEAVCRVGLCLAEALQYAHDRQLLHLDLKPENVLLAADGTPMLLDFHLARGPVAAGRAPTGLLGGTRDYMAPEQKEMMSAAAEGRPIPRAVGPRADVYSLGMVLYEALDGAPRFVGERPQPLWRRHPDVSRGLSDIVAKCLEEDPAGRYARAADLAEDLARHLAGRPLRFAPNRSLLERALKWRRRRPAALPVFLLVAALVGGLLTAALFMTEADRRRREAALAEARRALSEGRELLARGSFESAELALRRGAAATMPGANELRSQLVEAVRQARAGQVRQELRRVTDRLRFASPAFSAALLHESASLWERREDIMAAVGSDDNELAADLLDLAVLYSEAQARSTPADPAAGARNALGTIGEAERRFGTSHALLSRQARHARTAGQAETAAKAESTLAGWQPETPWEEYLHGRALLDGGEPSAAERWLRRAVEGRPGEFWPRFALGSCLFRLGRFAEAESALEVCVALRPGEAECYHNRGLCRGALGRGDEALADFGRALVGRPGHAPSHIQRGLLHYRARRFAEAAGDFRAAIDAGDGSAAARVNLALALLALGDRQGARRAADEALRQEPSDHGAKQLRGDPRLISD